MLPQSSTSPRFQAKHFDELTLRELQQIHITRSIVFTVGQQILAQEPDEADFDSVHFFHADETGRVLAYLRLFDLMTVDDGYHRPIEGAWTIGRVAVREEARGTGLGRALLRDAIEWARENTDARQLVISAQSYLKDSYYGAAGFVQVGEPYLEVGIEHVEMVLDL
ncbi:MAG: GNAT family N-acetyltransferase [Rothia sp.]|uniref:GNAT family N-acetyltransferase n=1 Tax=Rothia sp. (in: high G+C Gram-positive bacteria) TaxID=1885016 RepID=UPI001CB3EE32|nr:GNAT family N-acetyltransferase [Rothia sp. (in: high G+C Gram-positive bacteria)]MBF1680353.1 GNAT family N-acetyltransferase [Rothia sp. (in: high G+C Gram-positive bacteria)]